MACDDDRHEPRLEGYFTTILALDDSINQFLRKIIPLNIFLCSHTAAINDHGRT